MAAVAASTALMNKENKFRERSFSDNSGEHRNSQQQQQSVQIKAGGCAQINSTRYKTELCRQYEENGMCKYGDKCQFAHGLHELRSLTRHPKYKTELCRTFHSIGFCPYGPRCHFIHNADERRLSPSNVNGGQQSNGSDLRVFHQQHRENMNNFNQRPKLQHSFSFSEFSSSPGLDSPPALHSPTSRTPPPTTSSAEAAAAAVALYCEELLSAPPFSCANNAFSFSRRDICSLLTPLAVQTQNFGCQSHGYFLENQTRGGTHSSYTDLSSPTLATRRYSESPVLGTSPHSPDSSPDSLSDQESQSGSTLGSSGNVSDSESSAVDMNRRLPIFSSFSD